MQTIRYLYRIGTGPSSSHTMGPRRAAEKFLKANPESPRYRVTLMGSLAATGKGHLTNVAIQDSFAGKEMELVWKPEIVPAYHPNGMLFESLDQEGNLLSKSMVYSIGGGDLVIEGNEHKYKTIYPLTTMNDILEWAESTGKPLWEYVIEHEGEEIWRYLEEVWETMISAIERGLNHEGVLPGSLKLQRKASSHHARALDSKGILGSINMAYSFALAVSEENASGGTVVTAPTCGASGVLPGVLYFLKETREISRSKIIKALATAALVGNIVKFNGSISGAEVGCQGEVGTACAMSAAAATQILGGTKYQIEYAAEMALEHNLGLTCDPVDGLVQIPCIERNAMATTKSLSCAAYALLSDGRHRVSFDTVVETMLQTGKDLAIGYRETSESGLAEAVKKNSARQSTK